MDNLKKTACNILKDGYCCSMVEEITKEEWEQLPVQAQQEVKECDK